MTVCGQRCLTCEMRPGISDGANLRKHYFSGSVFILMSIRKNKHITPGPSQTVLPEI